MLEFIKNFFNNNNTESFFNFKNIKKLKKKKNAKAGFNNLQDTVKKQEDKIEKLGNTIENKNTTIEKIRIERNNLNDDTQELQGTTKDLSSTLTDVKIELQDCNRLRQQTEQELENKIKELNDITGNYDELMANEDEKQNCLKNKKKIEQKFVSHNLNIKSNIVNEQKKYDINHRKSFYEDEAFNRMKYRIWLFYLIYWILFVVSLTILILNGKITNKYVLLTMVFFAVYPLLLRYILIFAVAGIWKYIKNIVPKNLYLNI